MDKKFFSRSSYVTEKATTIMEDNQGAMCIAKNLVAHARTKQIDIHFHYIRSSE